MIWILYSFLKVIVMIDALIFPVTLPYTAVVQSVDLKIPKFWNSFFDEHGQVG